MAEGWLKLYRQITESAVFDNPKVLKVWIWCLCKASHKKHEVMVGNQIVLLQEGQFVFGRKKAAEILNINERSVYDYMKLLEKLNMIAMTSNNKFTIVSIEKWAFYQQSIGDNQQQTDSNMTTNQHQNHTNKNEKTGNNGNKKFIPPTVEEVSAYCIERGNAVDAESFINFYSSKGWMVGKNKMKDWKAAVRTWERKANGTERGVKRNGTNAEISRTQRENFNDFGF